MSSKSESLLQYALQLHNHNGDADSDSTEMRLLSTSFKTAPVVSSYIVSPLLPRLSIFKQLEKRGREKLATLNLQNTTRQHHAHHTLRFSSPARCSPSRRSTSEPLFLHPTHYSSTLSGSGESERDHIQERNIKPRRQRKPNPIILYYPAKKSLLLL